MNKSLTSLLDCPFCGDSPVMQSETTYDDYYVYMQIECSDCGAKQVARILDRNLKMSQSEIKEHLTEKVTAKWNKRASNLTN